ncbi:UNVERIFIED_CONTAM: Alkaline ceramidase [Sesamum latifolium]|uniref:Alkaline ceramidase n=1 Tax=Sesamum latifolium TaxID=2727402 RepID=A0AAW2XD22_9LAMI
MKHLWCGKCSSISTSSTHQTGTTRVRCPHSCSSTVQYSLSLIHSFVLTLVSKCTMCCFVFFAFQGCTSIFLTEDISAKRAAKLYVVTLLLGTVCWLADRQLCKDISRWSFNPQGHALWHILMGFNSYFKYVPHVLSCSATGLGSEGKTLVGNFPLCEDSEIEIPVERFSFVSVVGWNFCLNWEHRMEMFLQQEYPLCGLVRDML